jgi:hypothetical protein
LVIGLGLRARLVGGHTRTTGQKVELQAGRESLESDAGR